MDVVRNIRLLRTSLTREKLLKFLLLFLIEGTRLNLILRDVCCLYGSSTPACIDMSLLPEWFNQLPANAVLICVP